ncbi:hypothetical protein HYV84_08040, partial [Candidatus Woesearchaeota archaeon]|nr:hypothetical protein [Candidatus Woesearchaeota archaeon]
ESFTLTNGAFLTLGSYKFRFEEKPFEDVRQQTGITLTLKPEEKPTFEEISGLAGDNTATINTQVTFTSKVKTTQNIECQWEIYKEVQADGKVSWQAINAVTAFPQPLNNALTGIQPFQWVFDTLGRYLIKIQYKLPTAKVFSEGVQKLFIVKPHEPAPAQAPATTGMQLHQQQPPYGATPPFYLQGGYPPPGLGMGSTVVIIGHPTDGMRIVQGSSVYPLGQIHNAHGGLGRFGSNIHLRGINGNLTLLG